MRFIESFLNFLDQLNSGQKVIWVFACLSFSWVLEALIPLVNFSYKKIEHIGVNMVFTATTLLINAVFSLLTVAIVQWASDHQFGLLYLVDFGVWLELMVAICLLDLVAQYGVHFLLHKFQWMWKLHMVHHSDTCVDATTGTRHHPGDYFLREVFAIVIIGVSGMPLAYYLLYRLITILFTYLTHANIELPKTMDRLLSYVFVTPNMHKFHHHYKLPWTNTNFGNIFSIWDRIFSTLTYDETSKIQYGLDTLDGRMSNNLKYQFMLPFSGIKRANKQQK